MKRLIWAVCFLPLFVFSQMTNTVIPGRVSLRHFEADGVGFNGGYTTVEAMMAVPFNYQNIPFLDFRYHVFNRGRSAMNAGLGYRFNADGVLLGFNGYYDARWTTGQTFSQLGGGVEILSRFLDFRANGYFPLNRAKDILEAKFAGFFGNGLGINLKERLALTGGNAEMGAYIGRLGQIKMYLAGGAYYFKRQVCDTKIGASGRLRFSWRDNIWAQFSVQHDHLYKTNYQGTVSFSWPFWPKPRTQHWNFFPNFEALMIQPVERQEIIVLCDTQREVDADAFIWFVNNTNVGGTGTFEDPFQMLSSAQAASSPNEFIYVYPGDGTTTDMNAGIVLKSGQFLFGTGVEQIFPTKYGPVKVSPLSSSTPNISNGAGSAVTLARSHVIRGINIASPTANGILGTNVGTTIVDQVRITGAMADGINVTSTGSGTTNFDVVQTTITGSVNNGISLNLPAPSNTSTMNATIANSTVNSSVNFDGLSLVAADSSVVTLTVENSTFNSNAVDGVSLSLSNSTFTGTIDNNTFNSDGGSGVDIGAMSSVMGSITVSNNTVNMSGNHGINFSSGGTSRITATISDNTVTSSLMNGIAITGSGGSAGPTATLSNNVITSSAGPGISVTSTSAAPGVTATLNANTITSPSSDGLLLSLGSGGVMNVTADSNSISSPTGDGISITGSGSANLTASFSSTSISMSSSGVHGVQIDGAAGARIYNLTFSGNTITGPSSGAFDGINMTAYNTNNITLSASNNSITNFTAARAISVTVASGSPTVNLNISNNSNLSNNNSGIVIEPSGSSNFTTTIGSNTVATNSLNSFSYLTSGSSANQLTVTDNSFSHTATITTSDTSTLCLVMTNNTATTYALTNPGVANQFTVESSNAPSISDMQSSNTGTFSPLTPAGVLGVPSCSGP